MAGSTVGVMRLVRTDKGWLERYDVHRCESCDQPFNPYRATKGFLPCSCAGGNGHRLLHCPGCGHPNPDPPHVPQYGPTLDVGQGVSLHRPMSSS